jgi:hypothetical protein
MQLLHGRVMIFLVCIFPIDRINWSRRRNVLWPVNFIRLLILMNADFIFPDLGCSLDLIELSLRDRKRGKPFDEKRPRAFRIASGNVQTESRILQRIWILVSIPSHTSKRIQSPWGRARVQAATWALDGGILGEVEGARN